MTRLRLTGRAADTILAHARATAPEECCGLLVGRGDRVERAAPTRNLRASRDRYLVDPVEHFAVRRAARAEGLTVVGAYHSHPGGPLRPSAVDLAEAFEIGFVYVIAGPDPAGRWGRLAAFRFAGEGFAELGLDVEAE